MNSYGYGLDVAREASYPTMFANSTLLLPLLYSLMKEPHTPKTNSTFQTEYDYIIVGGGTAGSTVASRLSEDSDVTVLLLEAGIHAPLLTNVPHISQSFWQTDVDWKYFTVPQKYSAFAHNNQRIPFITGKSLGGSSSINAMLFVRGNSRDFDEWELMGARGWSYQEVLPYFKKMENNQNPKVKLRSGHGFQGPVIVSDQSHFSDLKEAMMEATSRLGYRIGDVNDDTQTGYFDPLQYTARNGQRCSAAKAYLVPAENRSNLDILLSSLATKIGFHNGSLRAHSVTFTRDGVDHTVRARREVIVSAGAINTPQLLMLSGIGPDQELRRIGIDTLVDLPVGKNFMDHSCSFLSYYINSSMIASKDKLDDPRNIFQYINNKTGPLSSQIDDIGVLFINKDEINPQEDSPNAEIFLDTNNAQDFETSIGLKTNIYNSYLRPHEGQVLLTCMPQNLQPKSRGTVTLKSSNPSDPPLIDPNYYEHPDDIEDILDGFKTCNKLAESEELQNIGLRMFEQPFPGCESFADDDYYRCIIRNVVLTSSHHSGTARMGDPSDPEAVVDPRLRVRGVYGLRVVDASVMPKITSGNTMTPVYMIAEKASDMIKEDWM